jgi:hypothetical protein
MLKKKADSSLGTRFPLHHKVRRPVSTRPLTFSTVGSKIAVVLGQCLFGYRIVYASYKQGDYHSLIPKCFSAISATCPPIARLAVAAGEGAFST